MTPFYIVVNTLQEGCSVSMWGIIVVGFVWIGSFVGFFLVARRWESKPQSSVLVKWREVRRWPLLALVSVLVGGMVAYFEWLAWLEYRRSPLWVIVLFIAILAHAHWSLVRPHTSVA